MTDKQVQKTLDSTRNLFITGPAGTGKSYLLSQYIDTHPGTLVCAPTGIAALNVGGDTMHRLFHIPVPCYEPPSFAKNNKKAVPKPVIRTLSMADTVVIDEISMCRADAFSYAIKVLRKAEKLKGSKIRVIVSGDFSQLPPVVRKGDEKLLKKFGFDPSGYAFTTSEWKSLNFKVVELDEIRRQDDVELVENLNRIRVGDFSHLDYFDRFVRPVDAAGDTVYICGTNSEADRLNMEYLDGLDGDAAAYMARKEGRASAGYVDEVVILKKGAKVIFTTNDNRGNAYRNGSFGTVVGTGSEGCTVEIDGKVQVIRPHEYPIHAYSSTGGVLSKKEIGKVRQLPLKLGHAITMHRSQGQTFERVCITPDVFAPGQLYVALSRVRSTEGLVLTRALTPRDLILDDTVQKFYKDGYKWAQKAKRKPAAKSPAKKDAPAAKSRTKNGASGTKTRAGTNVKPKTVKKPSAKKQVKRTAAKKTPKKTTAAKAKTKTRKG